MAVSPAVVQRVLDYGDGDVEENHDAQDSADEGSSAEGGTSTTESDDSRASVCSGRRGSARRKRQPVLVPKNTPFCHQGCCLRSSALIVSMIVLAIVGGMLRSLSPLLSAAALTLGPTAIIMSYFFGRYNFSTTKRQMLITFFEAVLWMVPLLAVISHIDSWNKLLTNTSVQIFCEFEGNGAGERFTWVLSASAQCAVESSEGNTTQVTSLSGISCPKEPHDGAHLVSEDGSIPKSVFMEMLNISSHGEGNATCGELVRKMDDVVGEVRVTSIARAERTVLIDSRVSLAKAYSIIFDYSSLSPDASDDVRIGFFLRVKTVLNAFVEAYFRAAFLEELLKYVAVRRVLFKDRVVDCGGLLAYGLAGGAGFATAENLQYTLMYGASVTYARMLLSIPLHCCTGLIIGIHLGYRKFLGQKCFCLVALIVPVFVHGTYDFLLMMPESIGGQEWRVLIVALLLGLSFLYARCAWLLLDNVCVVDVRSMMRAGVVSAPRFCCCERDSLSVWFVHQDPLLPQPAFADPAAGPAERSGSGSPLSRLARSVTNDILPSEPPCQTKPMSCPSCSSGVRAHILYESFCPHCGARMPDLASPPLALRP